MNLRQAAQQALEALEILDKVMQRSPRTESAITALRAALEEPKQEPVAYFDPQEKGFYWARPTVVKALMSVSVDPLPLYSAPTQRKPLTDEALHQVIRAGNYDSMEQFARAIERKHGIGA